MNAAGAPLAGAPPARPVYVSAGFGRRAAALLYDALLLAALLMIFTAAMLPFTHGRALLAETAGAWVYLYRAGLLAVIGAYYALNWIRSGQTLGMRAWRLRVVDAGGHRIGVRQALWRLGCGLLAWPPAALGVLWLYVDPARLALHDRLSGTRVVQLARA